MCDENNQEGMPQKPEETADKPHPDQSEFWNNQRDYWVNDLKRKDDALEYQRKSINIARRSLIVSLLGFTLVIISICINSCQLALNTRQSELNYQAATNAELNLKVNAQQSMTKITMDLDKIIIDHPELRRYLESNANPHLDSTNYDRAVEAAIMTFDVFDMALAQAGTFKGEWTNPGGWTNWIIENFARSPFLREQYLKCASWYGPNMTALATNSFHLTNVYFDQYETNPLPGGTNY